MMSKSEMSRLVALFIRQLYFTELCLIEYFMTFDPNTVEIEWEQINLG